jgi:Mg2+ and Co2+ transporter CorA
VFDDLIYFWKKERPPVFNPANPTLASLSYYPLKIVAAEWMSFTNLMSYSVEHYECSIEDHTISVTELTKLESYSRHLQSWRRCSVTSASIVRSLASFVKSGSIDLPGPEIWTSLVHDYEYIAATIDSYGRRLEAMTPVITSFIMIVESRRSFLETMNVSRLSYLALIFVPLTFVSSLFSMSEDTAPGSEGFWVYFAVAIPLLALVFLIAGPHNGGIMWITNYLRGRRGRNRDVEIGYCGGEKPKETVHRLVDENL